MAGGGGAEDGVTYTNLIPTYIPGMQDKTVGYLEDSALLSLNNFTVYSGDTYAVEDTNEADGIAALGARGGSGSVIEADGETYLQSLYDDSFIAANTRRSLDFDKRMETILQSLNEDILPAIRDNYAFAFGGSEHNMEEVKAAEKAMASINDLGKTVYYDDYRMERRAQDAGLSHAVPYGERGLRDAEMLRAAGVYTREWLQGDYTNAWNKYNEDQIIPLRNLDILGNALRSIMGVMRTTSTKYYKPPAINQIAGVALSGMSLYNMFRNTTLNAYSGKAGSALKSVPATDQAAKDNNTEYAFDWNGMKNITPQVGSETTLNDGSNTQ